MALDQKCNLFTEWLAEMDISADGPSIKDAVVKSAKLLGKSERTVRYYIDGTMSPPQDVLFLMDALHQGYRPRRWALRK